jgi:hypothetical protein
MEIYKVEATASTPRVEHDPQRGLLTLEGESYPENALAFYEPLFKRLRSAEPGEALEVRVRLAYFNSSSSKCLMDLMELLGRRAERGERIRLEWRYDADDEDMREAGQEFAEDAAFDFELVQNPEE